MQTHTSDELLYQDLYQCVLDNKEIFEERSKQYYKTIVNPIWVDNGKRKLDLSPNDQSINAYDFYDGDALFKKAFSWFCCMDLTNTYKYFGKNNVAHSNYYSCGEYLLMSCNTPIYADLCDWDVRRSYKYLSISDLSYIEVSGSSYQNKQVSGVIVDTFKLTHIKDLLPQGFTQYNNKQNSHKTLQVISKITNKMDLMIWKKNLKSVDKLTQSNFKALSNVYMGEFEVDCWNEFSKDKVLISKQFFKDSLSKATFTKGTKAINLGIVQTKLLSYTFADGQKCEPNEWLRGAIIHLCQNVDLSTCNYNDDFLNIDDFIAWVESNNTFASVGFDTDSNSFFTESNFKKHLVDLHS